MSDQYPKLATYLDLKKKIKALEEEAAAMIPAVKAEVAAVTFPVTYAGCNLTKNTPNKVWNYPAELSLAVITADAALKTFQATNPKAFTIPALGETSLPFKVSILARTELV